MTEGQGLVSSIYNLKRRPCIGDPIIRIIRRLIQSIDIMTAKSSHHGGRC